MDAASGTAAITIGISHSLQNYVEWYEARAQYHANKTIEAYSTDTHEYSNRQGPIYNKGI